METNIRPAAGWSHDAIDSLVAAILGWWERCTARQPEAEIAFSDEWERRFLYRELH